MVEIPTKQIFEQFYKALYALTKPGDPFIIQPCVLPMLYGGMRLHFGPEKANGIDEFRTLTNSPNKKKFPTLFSPRGVWYAFDFDWFLLRQIEAEINLGTNIFDLVLDPSKLTSDLTDAGKHMLLVVRDVSDAIKVHDAYSNDKGFIWSNIKRDFDGLEVRFQCPHMFQLTKLIAEHFLGEGVVTGTAYKSILSAVNRLDKHGRLMPWLFNLEFPSGVLWKKSNVLLSMRPLPVLAKCIQEITGKKTQPDINHFSHRHFHYRYR